MKKKYLVALLATIAFNSSIMAFEPFTVEEIQVEGLKRYNEGTVLTYLPVQIGDMVDKSSSIQIIKTLYSTGFFKSIDLEHVGGTLVVKITEKPVISEIHISGNKALKTKDLKQGLKDAGLSKGSVFSYATVSHVEQDLIHTYQNLGQYQTKVNVSYQHIDAYRVRLNIQIEEGKIAKITDIHFVGNHNVKSSTLRSQMKLHSHGWMSWLSKNSQYAKEKLSVDIEAIKAYYLDRGYAKMRILSSDVAITPETQEVHITISIQEGQKFRVGNINIEGDTTVAHQELQKLVTVKSNDIFSRRKIIQSSRAISDRLGEEGFAFANINPVPELHDDSQTVDLTFYINEAKRAYVRRIYFKGNNKTHDQVLRREVTQMEAAVLNTKKLKGSQAKLNRLGYFKNVNIDTLRVPDADDLVDVSFSVEEAPSGSIQGGIGYSSAEGLLVNAQVSNRNFMGTGNTLNVEFNNSKSYTIYNIGYKNPYVTLDGVSREFNIFYNETKLSKISSVSSYTTDAYGANLTYGFPITLYSHLTFGIGVEKNQISLNRTLAPNEILSFLEANGSQYFQTILSLGWKYNSLDRYIFPESGVSLNIKLSVSAPGSDLEYYKATFNSKWFHPLGKGYTFNLNTRLGYGDSYGHTTALPFFQHYFAGGSKAIRGYEENSLGPRDSNGRPFGGNLMSTASFQLVLPNYFSPENKTVRAALFLDAGQIYDLRNKTRIVNDIFKSRNQDGFRYSAGISVTWMSPVAPLVFSLGFPLNKHFGDEVQIPNFSFGTFFN